MISIANIYKFSLPGEINLSQESNIEILTSNLKEYFESERLTWREEKKIFSPNYSVKSFLLEENLGKIYIFFKTGASLPYFYPEIFCEVWLKKEFIENETERKKAIFFLSNSFECFEFLDEKNLMIEFHSSIREAIIPQNFMQKDKKFSLRFDFIDVGSIGELDEKYNGRLFEDFIEQKWELHKNMKEIKVEYPENYRTLLVFLYHIFSLTKNLKRTSNELEKIRRYEEENGENMHINISEERLKMTQENIQKVLEKYTQIFESFFEIM